MLPMLPPKSSTFLPPQSFSPSCSEKYVNCPVFDEKKAILRVAVKELAVQIIRTTTAVEKRREQHDHEHAFVDAQVCVCAHEAEIESRGHGHRALSCFFFEVCERCCACSRPVDRSVFADAGDVDDYFVPVARDGAFR